MSVDVTQLVYLLSAIEHSGTKIDFAVSLNTRTRFPILKLTHLQNAPAPVGRNANGCVQKMFKIKNALRAEIDAIKNGDPLAPAAETTPKKAGVRNRKATADEDGLATSKKRGRAKKHAAPEAESHVPVKDEPEDEFEIEMEKVED
jgi:hypothetical protein